MPSFELHGVLTDLTRDEDTLISTIACALVQAIALRANQKHDLAAALDTRDIVQTLLRGAVDLL